MKEMNEREILDALPKEVMQMVVDYDTVRVNIGSYNWYLAYRRSFLGSCSSHWSWGLDHIPACPAKSPGWYSEKIVLDGPVDLIGEVGIERIAQGIKACIGHKETGITKPVYFFDEEVELVTLEVHKTYEDGVIVTPDSIKRLRVLHAEADCSSLNQPGYFVIQKTDNAVHLIVDAASDDNEYLTEKISELDRAIGLNVARSPVGNLYYVNENVVVGDAINRNWHSLKRWN